MNNTHIIYLQKLISNYLSIIKVDFIFQFNFFKARYKLFLLKLKLGRINLNSLFKKNKSLI